MDILIIIVLIIAAVVLFSVELFVIPGISVAGFPAGGCIIFANYYAFTYLGTTGGFITLGISAIACIGSLVLFMRSKTLDKIALKKNITSKVDRTAEDQVKVGDTGVAFTRLALIGNAEFNGNIVEVKSMDGFLNEKTPIIVSRITDGVIMVEKIKRLVFTLKYRINHERRLYVLNCLSCDRRHYLHRTVLPLCSFLPMVVRQSFGSQDFIGAIVSNAYS